MWSNCLYHPFCSELHRLPISYLTFYIKRHLFREAIRSRVLVGFTMNSAKALSTVLGIHSCWMNQFGNCQNVGFWEGKDKWRPNAFISKRKKEKKMKNLKVGRIKKKKQGEFFSVPRQSRRRHNCTTGKLRWRGANKGEIIYNYRQSCFRG